MGCSNLVDRTARNGTESEVNIETGDSDLLAGGSSFGMVPKVSVGGSDLERKMSYASKKRRMISNGTFGREIV